MQIVRANNVETWASTLDARSMLPGVVRRLVHATGKDCAVWISRPAKAFSVPDGMG